MISISNIKKVYKQIFFLFKYKYILMRNKLQEKMCISYSSDEYTARRERRQRVLNQFFFGSLSFSLSNWKYILWCIFVLNRVSSAWPKLRWEKNLYERKNCQYTSDNWSINDTRIRRTRNYAWMSWALNRQTYSDSETHSAVNSNNNDDDSTISACTRHIKAKMEWSTYDDDTTTAAHHPKERNMKKKWNDYEIFSKTIFGNWFTMRREMKKDFSKKYMRRSMVCFCSLFIYLSLALKKCSPHSQLAVEINSGKL